MSSRCTILAVAAFIGSGAAAVAQTPAIPQAPGVYKLQLKADPQLKYGKIAAVEGLVTSAGQKLAVSDLSVTQPVQVTLQSLDKNDDLTLELAGGGWAVGAFYQTDVKTGLAVSETKLQADLKEAQEIKNSRKEGFEAMSEVNEAGKSLYEAAEALDKYKEMQEA